MQFSIQNLVDDLGKLRVEAEDNLQDEGQAANRLGSQARETGRVRHSRLSFASGKVSVAREGGGHREMDQPCVFTKQTVVSGQP